MKNNKVYKKEINTKMLRVPTIEELKSRNFKYIPDQELPGRTPPSFTVVGKKKIHAGFSVEIRRNRANPPWNLDTPPQFKRPRSLSTKSRFTSYFWRKESSSTRAIKSGG